MDVTVDDSRAAEMAAPGAALSVAEPARDHGHAPEHAGLGSLCGVLADRWCESFGVESDAARSRLAGAVATAFAAERADMDGPGDFDERLHGLARTAIEVWFAACGVSARGRDFDRVRHAFLAANRDGRWSESFLADDVDRESLRHALTARLIAATPARAYASMIRQTL